MDEEGTVDDDHAAKKPAPEKHIAPSYLVNFQRFSIH